MCAPLSKVNESAASAVAEYSANASAEISPRSSSSFSRAGAFARRSSPSIGASLDCLFMACSSDRICVSSIARCRKRDYEDRLLTPGHRLERAEPPAALRGHCRRLALRVLGRGVEQLSEGDRPGVGEDVFVAGLDAVEDAVRAVPRRALLDVQALACVGVDGP